MTTSAKRGPLSGITVIEMEGLGPGPFAGMMLADAGARIIRVRRLKFGPVNVTVRSSQDPLSRGRIDLALDLKKRGGVDVLLRLVESADALIEGYRPGVMERLGAGPNVCLARKPDLVYGRMTGWGQFGSLAHAAGHDINYIAISGALHAIGSSDRPIPPLTLVGDFGGGGAMLAFGIASALVDAARTGKGQVVDTAMSDGAAYLMAPYYARLARGSWRDRREDNVLDGGAPHYGVYRCADGKFIAVGPLEPQFWSLFLKLIGLDDESAFQQRDDPAQWSQLRELLARRFAVRTRDDWCRILEGEDTCVAAVLSMEEAPHHPHNMARRTFINVDGAKIPAPMPRFSLSDNAAPPAPIDDAAAVSKMLLAAGFVEDEIAALRAKAVLG